MDDKFVGEQSRVLPAAGLAVIPNGRVLTRSGAVIAPPDCLISEVAQNFLSTDPGSNLLFLSIKLPAVRRLEGSVAVLTSTYANNYFHWLFDTLPRLQLIRQSTVHYDWLVAPRQTSFQVESLSVIGSTQEEVLDLSLFHVQATKLLVPTLPGFTGNPPKWACEFLRAAFINTTPQRRPDRKVYISRWKSGTRKILNEPELLAALEKQGFEAVSLEDLSFPAQVELFAGAKIVIGAHGAGLSNLVFCSPGAGVVEIFGPNYINVVYWAISNQVGLRYTYVKAHQASVGAMGIAPRVHENFNVSIQEVLAAAEVVAQPSVC